jgi:N-acyl-D-aspartate/D-glutamate deacylase
VLGRYVREEKVLTLEQAVQKMTSMPAMRLGLTDRGCLRAGCAADVTIFSAQEVSDVGTFADPHHYPKGIPWVIVNGVPVVDNGTFTAARPGKVLRRGAPATPARR